MLTQNYRFIDKERTLRAQKSPELLMCPGSVLFLYYFKLWLYKARMVSRP